MTVHARFSEFIIRNRPSTSAWFNSPARIAVPIRKFCSQRANGLEHSVFGFITNSRMPCPKWPASMKCCACPFPPLTPPSSARGLVLPSSNSLANSSANRGTGPRRLRANSSRERSVHLSRQAVNVMSTRNGDVGQAGRQAGRQAKQASRQPSRRIPANR